MSLSDHFCIVVLSHGVRVLECNRESLCPLYDLRSRIYGWFLVRVFVQEDFNRRSSDNPIEEERIGSGFSLSSVEVRKSCRKCVVHGGREGLRRSRSCRKDYV